MNIRSFLRSFRFAYEGLIYVLMTQRNMQIHFMMAFAVCGIGFLLQLDKVDMLFLLFAIVMVIVTEMINTAVEKAVDLASPEWHPLAKIAKDVAAGAVMMTSLFSLVVGMVVFYPVIDRIFKGLPLRNLNQTSEGNVWLLWVAVVIVMVIVIGLQSWAQHRQANTQTVPGLITAVAFAMAFLISYLAPDTRVILISMTLAALTSFVTVERNESRLITIGGGALLGLLVPLFFVLTARLFF